MSYQGLSDVKHAVVTGGSGAIGARLVRRLLDEGLERVWVVDDLSSGYAWLLPDDPRVVLIRADVCGIETLGIDAREPVVFHLAAFFANQNSVDHPPADLHCNGLGTLKTLMWSADIGARCVIYASAGCSIAGHGLDVPIREDMPVSLHLDTPYQITKALGEFYCNYFSPRVPTVRCRFFNSYGPGEVPGRYRNVIPNFVWWAMHGQPLPITGTGDETRDFIFVDDLVDGLVRCAGTPEARGEAINLGTGIQTTVRHLAEVVLALTGSQSAIEYRPRRAWDHSRSRQADIGKARAVLGLEPSVATSAGLERTVAWFRDHLDQIRPVASANF
ncbi:MAG: NAD-dependent epimerase/dehydratase family protein [Myxococcales bacterium]|nr:NAD-dependent epimerase/dehydratase family protein [Myxococcales bacterium]